MTNKNISSKCQIDQSQLSTEYNKKLYLHFLIPPYSTKCNYKPQDLFKQKKIVYEV